MDGSSRNKIVTSAIKWPSSIAVDHGAKRVYWTDYRLQQIQLCNFDGSNRKVLIKGLGGPTSIALLGRFVYWSEWNSKVIKKVDKRLKTPAMTVISGMRRLIGIKAVTLQKYPGYIFFALSLSQHGRLQALKLLTKMSLILSLRSP